LDRYNSAIFVTKPINNVTLLVVTAGFMTGAPVNIDAAAEYAKKRRSMTMEHLSQAPSGGLAQARLDVSWSSSPNSHQWNFEVTDTCGEDRCASYQAKAMNGTFAQKIEKAQCIQTYLKAFGDRSDVLLVTSNDLLDPQQSLASLDTSLLFVDRSVGIQGPGKYWPCGSTNVFDCRKPQLWMVNASVIEDWNVLGYKIDYCLSTERSIADSCSVKYSQLIMISKEHFLCVPLCCNDD
jgi:hypothetical protein